MSRMGDLQRRSKELFSKEFFKGQKLTAEEAKEASEIACIFEIHAHLATAMLGPGKSTNFLVLLQVKTMKKAWHLTQLHTLLKSLV